MVLPSCSCLKRNGQNEIQCLHLSMTHKHKKEQWPGLVRWKIQRTSTFFPAKYSSLTKFLKVTVYPAWFISNCRLSSYLRFHTGLCKVLRNISTNIWSLGKRKSLKLREVPSLFIFYNITIALLIPLDGFQFFLLRQWKHMIVYKLHQHSLTLAWISLLNHQSKETREEIWLSLYLPGVLDGLLLEEVNQLWQ